MRRITVIALSLLILLVPGCHSRAGDARISFTGDIIMHIPVKSCARSHDTAGARPGESLNNRGFDFLFERIRDAFSESDIVVGNMEFPLAPPFQSRPKIFNCEPAVLGALKKAGFNVLHAANNHILDQGEAGVITTMNYLREHRIDFIGIGRDDAEARAGIVKTSGGIRVGLIGYTGYLNYRRPAAPAGYRLNWVYERDRVAEDIAAAKKRCDFLVMVVHTGLEYRYRPREKDTKLFREYIDLGVDLIIGHHPHVVQPAARVIAADGRVCYIFYSLGNFISNQSTKAEIYLGGVPLTTRDAIIVHCRLSRAGLGRRPGARFEVVPVYTVNIAEEGTRRRVIQTVPIGAEIRELKSGLSRASAKEKVDIERRLQLLYQKIGAVKAAVYDGADLKEVAFIY